MTDASYATPHYARFRLPANARHVSLRRQKRAGEPAYRSYGPAEAPTSVAFANVIRRFAEYQALRLHSEVYYHCHIRATPYLWRFWPRHNCQYEVYFTRIRTEDP